MKKLIIALFILANVGFAKPIAAQQKLTAKALVGVWQLGAGVVGDQLNQSFVFFSDGKFSFNNGKNGDDIVSTIQLLGRYRLDRNKMYFTITSRVVIDGARVGVVNSSLDFGIFEFKDGISKEIKEKNLKEIEDPAIVTIIKPNHIKINDEDYYKITSNPNDARKL
jgi:hypothetical protein